MHFEISFSEDIQHRDLGLHLKAIANLLEVINAMARNITVQIPDRLKLSTKISRITAYDERQFVYFYIGAILRESVNAISVTYVICDEPHFLIKNKRATPEEVFNHIFGDILERYCSGD